MPYYKKKTLLKHSTKTATWINACKELSIYVCKELSTTPIGKWFFKQAIYVRYLLVKLSKFAQTST